MIYTKRFFIIVLVLVLACSIFCIPAFAAESYAFQGHSRGYFADYADPVPEGRYTAIFEGLTARATISEFDVSYSASDSAEICSVPVTAIYEDGSAEELSFSIRCETEGSGAVLVYVKLQSPAGSNLLYDGNTLMLYPVTDEESASTPDFSSIFRNALSFTVDNMLGVISSILPVALPVAGAILVIILGWKLFKKFTSG